MKKGIYRITCSLILFFLKYFLKAFQMTILSKACNWRTWPLHGWDLFVDVEPSRPSGTWQELKHGWTLEKEMSAQSLMINQGGNLGCLLFTEMVCVHQCIACIV